MQMTRYTVRFVSPAFLGDAEQKGAWRSPPFKALMRQWWRVLAAQEANFNYKQVRRKEGELFGHAWLEGNGGKTWAMKSRILLRLSRWEPGDFQHLTAETSVYHPEAGEHGRKIDTNLYLGYGPLTYDNEKKKTKVKVPPAIKAGDSAELALGYPDELREKTSELMQLLHWFGSVGGRSRNGWGSIIFDGQDILGFEALSSSHPLIRKLSRPMEECLKMDWPHAIGTDAEGRGCIWRTRENRPTWNQVMEDLAKIKIKFRTAFVFTRNKDLADPRIDKRHILALPVTNHGVKEWSEHDADGKPILDKKGRLKPRCRLANQLRFKLAQTQKGYFGIVYHLPCRFPEQLLRELGSPQDRQWVRTNESTIWSEVHASLDQSLQRL